MKIRIIDDEIRWVQKCENEHIRISYDAFKASLYRIREEVNELFIKGE